MPIPAPSGEKPTALDIFCGVGGLSLGLSQAGFQLVGGADLDEQTLETHKLNFPGVPTHPCDLFEETGSAIRKGLGLGTKVIDLLAGGPPCQGFSTGGVRAKSDPRNQGIMAFARLVEELRPRYFLMENVRGFLFRDHEELRGAFTKGLKAAGYKVLDFRLLNAADYGVPQRRERAFVMGCIEEETLPAYPLRQRGRRPTVRSAITDLRVLDECADDPEVDVYNGKLGKPSAYGQRLRGARDGGRKFASVGIASRESDE